MSPRRASPSSQELKKAAGAADVDRDKAEAELFGGGGKSRGRATPGRSSTSKAMDSSSIRSGRAEDPERPASAARTEIEDGVVLNAAVFLKDPSKLDAAMKDIEAHPRPAAWT